MAPRDIVFAVIMVFQVNVGSIIGTATGFFMKNDKGEPFFITNKHVVEDTEKRPYEYLVLKVHKSFDDLTKIVDVPINLTKENGEKAYNYFQEDIDIIAIPLSKSYFDSLAVRYIQRENYPPEFMTLDYGTKLSVIGYPRGFTDHNKFIPVLKMATAATPPLENFNNFPFFLMDGNLKSGMSGSPVFSELTSSFDSKDGGIMSSGDSPKFYFLGIHSSSIHKTVGKLIEPQYEIKSNDIIIKSWKEIDLKENLELHSCYLSGVITQLMKN